MNPGGRHDTTRDTRRRSPRLADRREAAQGQAPSPQRQPPRRHADPPPDADGARSRGATPIDRGLLDPLTALNVSAIRSTLFEAAPARGREPPKIGPKRLLGFWRQTISTRTARPADLMLRPPHLARRSEHRRRSLPGATAGGDPPGRWLRPWSGRFRATSIAPVVGTTFARSGSGVRAFETATAHQFSQQRVLLRLRPP
jgi:hypothetical protein